jgi:ferritin
MELKKNVLDALNSQITHEFDAKFLYLSMSAYFERLNLNGFAKWFRNQAKEEDSHAMKLFDYINDRNADIALKAVEEPKSGWENPLQAAQDALASERKVTGLIHSLRKLAQSEEDQATEVFLNWFVEEQVEEESQATELAEKLKTIGNDQSALLMLDQELGKRE